MKLCVRLHKSQKPVPKTKIKQISIPIMYILTILEVLLEKKLFTTYSDKLDFKQLLRI